MGVLFLGVLGSPMIGYKQDVDMDKRLSSGHTQLYQQIKGDPKAALLGSAPSLNQEKIKALPEASRKELEAVQAESKKHVFVDIAALPVFMLLCYLGLFLYFKRKGGYKAMHIDEGVAAPEF